MALRFAAASTFSRRFLWTGAGAARCSRRAEEQCIAGRQFDFGPDGTRLFVDAGTFQFKFLVDDGGTPTDPFDDVEIEGSFELVKDVGRTDLADRDFCDDIHEFIG